MSGSYSTRRDPEITVHFSTLDEFPSSPGDAERFSVNAGNYGEAWVHLRLGSDKRTVDLSVSVPGDRRDNAIAAVATFESTAGLKAVTAESDVEGESERVSFRRKYRQGARPSASLIDFFKTHFAPFAWGPTSAGVTTGPGERALRLADVELLSALPEGTGEIRSRMTLRDDGRHGAKAGKRPEADGGGR